MVFRTVAGQLGSAGATATRCAVARRLGSGSCLIVLDDDDDGNSLVRLVCFVHYFDFCVMASNWNIMSKEKNAILVSFAKRMIAKLLPEESCKLRVCSPPGSISVSPVRGTGLHTNVRTQNLQSRSN